MAFDATLRVEFVTDRIGNKTDPSNVLPAGWDPGSGFIVVPTAFKGSWTYRLDTADQDSTPGKGDFRFSDPNLRIHVDAAGLCFDFQLDKIVFSYAAGAGKLSHFSILGSRDFSNFSGITSESIQIMFGRQDLPGSVIPSVDTPDPIPGSPWEDGSGVSQIKISGSNGLSGGGEVSYQISKVLGSYSDPVAL